MAKPMLEKRTISAYKMTSMPEAMDIIIQTIAHIRATASPVSLQLGVESVQGYVLSDEVKALNDVPARECSRLDGYAVSTANCVAGETYVVHHYRRAGHASATAVAAGTLAYITTGAPLPAGTDGIVKVEDTEPVRIEADHVTRVRLLPQALVKAGEGVRTAGSDVQAGTVLLPSGHLLTALDVGMLLSARISTVRVLPRLRVGVLSSGDELVGPTPTSAGTRRMMP
jgi:gephyrin